MASSSKSSRILVTGGAGFIGSALVWALNLRGQEDILVTDRLGTDEKWKNLVALKYADYLDADDLLKLVETRPDALGKFDVVYHLGANSATTERDAHHLMKNNFEYTKTLAHWALGMGARFVSGADASGNRQSIPRCACHATRFSPGDPDGIRLEVGHDRRERRDRHDLWAACA